MERSSNRLQARNWKQYAPKWQTFLSGVLLVLAFPPWGFWPLIWISLIPWFSALRNTSSYRQAIAQGFWLCYFMSWGGFYWVAAVLQEFGNLPWILGVLGHQVFCTFGQLQFTFFAPLFKFWDAHPILPNLGQNLGQNSRPNSAKSFPSWIQKWKTATLNLTLLGASYTGLDWVLPKQFVDTLGHALFPAKFLRQAADLGGAPLLTFLVFVVNWSVWQLFIRLLSRSMAGSMADRMAGKMKLLRSYRSHSFPTYAPNYGRGAVLGNALLLLFSFWIYGFFRTQQIHKLIEKAPSRVRAAAIQANIGDFEKLAAENGVVGAADRIIETYTRMSDEALNQTPKPDFIVWPETSYPSTFRSPQTPIEFRLDNTVDSYVRSHGVPLFFGGYDRYQEKDYNSFFFLSPDGNLKTYHKNILLLFGEFIPGAEIFPIIKETFPQVGNFGRGIGPEVLEVDLSHSNPSVGTLRVSPIICYEALFSTYLIDSARKGSQLILNITNDSWFGTWGEPQLHLALSVFRSIETRLPMFRATNTGISALILPDGEITHATELGEARITQASIPLSEPIPTLMKAWGDWFGWVCALIGLGCGLIGLSEADWVKLLRKKPLRQLFRT